MDANELSLLLPLPSASDSKFSRGTVGFVTGSDSYPGAALLGVAAAQGTSVGFVRHVGPRRVGDLLLLAHPEVVTSETYANAGPVQAWVIGSGVARCHSEQLQNCTDVLAAAQVAVVDAGALALIGEVPLAEGGSRLLTPHAGEACALMNRLGISGKLWHPELLDQPAMAAEAARALAEATGCTVLLKGSITRVASPAGESVEIGPNSPWLATAGTGDVLAGILGGIAAQNPEVAQHSWLDIARLAVELHSAAAEIAARSGAVTASAVAANVGLAIRERFNR
jgi:hydroxyethylthiazole kinase-like uncharacterized protein yjeF